MLQPRELNHANTRFATECHAVRTFLHHASLVLDEESTMRVLAERLVTDRAFHRDLTSHVWALLEERRPDLSSADLLAILAIAAAGTRLAQETDASDAHALLRFLMKAKHQFAAGNGEQVLPTLKDVVPERAHTPVPPLMQEVGDLSPAKHEPTFDEIVLTQHAGAVVKRNRVSKSSLRGRRWLLPVTAAIGLAAAALLSYVLLRPGTDQGQIGRQQSAPIVSHAPDMQNPHADVVETQSRPAMSRLSALERYLRSLRGDKALKFSPSTSLPNGAPATPDSSSGTAASSNRLEPQIEAPIETSDHVIAADPAAVGRMRDAMPLNPGVPRAVPAEVLSRRLDSPTLPSYAAETTGKRYPRLLRRSSLPDTDDATGNQLSASLEEPDFLGNVRSGDSGMPARNLVRSTCLGMMASNLIYSPNPPYPAKAASAGVQGEVRIQATVDRDGTVNGARVISGPPLLRDAAMGAIQRWRYRPYTGGGKPTPASTTAVVEFQLQ